MLQEITIDYHPHNHCHYHRKTPLSKEPEGERVDDQFCVELAGRLHMLGWSGSNHSSCSMVISINHIITELQKLPVPVKCTPALLGWGWFVYLVNMCETGDHVCTWRNKFISAYHSHISNVISVIWWDSPQNNARPIAISRDLVHTGIVHLHHYDEKHCHRGNVTPFHFFGYSNFSNFYH